jgi:hypothetical protein
MALPPHQLLSDSLEFEPALPPWKLGSLARVAPSPSVHVALSYGSPFWAEQLSGAGPAPSCVGAPPQLPAQPAEAGAALVARLSGSAAAGAEAQGEGGPAATREPCVLVPVASGVEGGPSLVLHFCGTAAEQVCGWRRGQGAEVGK